MEKGDFVKDIVPNKRMRGFFIVQAPDIRSSSNGPFWFLRLSDRTGDIPAKIWFPKSAEFSAIPAGSLAFAEGQARLYREQTEITLDAFRLLDPARDDAPDLADLLKSSPFDRDEMFAELENLCRTYFTWQPWRKLVFSVLKDSELGALFRIYPAATRMHHAYVGGLLEHTLGVFKLCCFLADRYPYLDRQTLLAGALFHDIGKLREFCGAWGMEYSDDGKLQGHIMLGLEILAPFLARSGLDDALQQHLKHLLLSHHGKLEFGSAKLPQTAEALALSYADDLDAKLFTARDLFSENDAGCWSARQFSLDRQLFHARRTPDCQKTDRARKNASREQCLSLLKE